MEHNFIKNVYLKIISPIREVCIQKDFKTVRGIIT